MATGCCTDPRKLNGIHLKPAASAPSPTSDFTPACPVSYVTDFVTATGQLYASTRYDGILSSWTITSSGLPGDNHFGGIAALELLPHQSVASVIAGGTDDGITVLHMLRSRNQLTQAMTITGFPLTYRDEVLVVQAADGQTIDHQTLLTVDLIGAACIPQVILPEFVGPVWATPTLPQCPGNGTRGNVPKNVETLI